MEKKKGRPNKLTAEVVARFVDGLEEGLPIKSACQYAGISHRTYRRWMIQAEEDLEAGEITVFVAFCHAVYRAQATFEYEGVKKWKSAFDDDYRAIRDMFERRFPDRWGKKTQHEITGEVQHGVVLLPPLDTPDDTTGEDAQVIDAEYEQVD